MNPLQQQDPAVWDAIEAEAIRQQDGLEMIASENISTGDLIAFIPEEMILDFETAHSSKAVTQLKEQEILWLM